MNMKSVGFLGLFFMMFSIGFGSADFGVMSHSAFVTLSPEFASCEDGYPNQFNVNIFNDGSAGDYDIYNVKIYKAQTNIVALTCGAAPAGWTTTGVLEYGLYCEYVTDPLGDFVIEQGEDLNFTFDAVLDQVDCTSTFRITTLDNEAVVTGEGDGSEVNTYKILTVDCEKPVISKDVGFPKILLDSNLNCDSGSEVCDWWMNYETGIDFLVTDNFNPDDDQNCNLGMDYCEYEVSIDGEHSQEYSDVFNSDVGENIEWAEYFLEDSNHVIELICYDKVGNFETLSEWDKVDGSAPITTKMYGTPNFAVGGDINDGEITQPHYITTDTLITFTAEDPDDTGEGCNIGVKETWYKVCQEPCYDVLKDVTHVATDSVKCSFVEYKGQPFTINEESEHSIEFYSVDLLGNEEVHTRQCVYVENQAPLDEKWIGEPAIVEINAVSNDEEMYVVKIVNPSSSPVATAVVFEGLIASWSQVNGDDVDFAVSDDIGYYFDAYHGSCTGLNGNGCGPDSVDQTWEEWLTAHSDWMDWSSTSMGTAFPGGDEEEELAWDNGQVVFPGVIEANDILWVVVRLKFNADDTFRFTMKAGGLEVYHRSLPEEYTVWVNDVTSVDIGCEDPLPHPVGNEEVCFKIGYDRDPLDLTSLYCDTSNGGYMNGDYCCENKVKVFTFGEDSMHNLEFYCEDALGNAGELDIENFKVDSQPPIITRTLVGPTVGACDQGDSGDCWIKDWYYEPGTAIVIDAVDDDSQICAVEQITCDWMYYLDDEPMSGELGVSVPFEIKFMEDTQHEIVVKCRDALGNEADYEEVLFLDSVGPVVYHEFFGPYSEVNGVEWIDGVSTIELTVEYDQPFESVCAVGEDEIYYVVSEMDDMACWDEQTYCMANQYDDFGAFTLYSGAIGGIDESCHMIEYYSVDLLGNKGPIERDCFFVDKTVPKVWHVNDAGMIFDDTDATLGDFHWMTQEMSIDLYCEDQGDHPSNGVTMFYTTWNDIDGVWDEWDSVYNNDLAEKTITFGEDSVHRLKYYCEDAVEKTTDTYEVVYRVDTTEPSVDLILHEPYFGDCDLTNLDHDECFVDTATRITLDIEDGGAICAVGGVECEWRYTVNGGEYSAWFDYDGSISFSEESNHVLYVECTDALGNTAYIDDWFSVDKTAPGIDKDYGMPFESYGFGDYWAKWITSDTPVFGEVTDDGPHMSGIAEVKYRTFVVDDEDCKNYYPEAAFAATVVESVPSSGGSSGGSASIRYNCDDVDNSAYSDSVDWKFVDFVDYGDFEFKIPEDSCHMIEIMATDNVGKCALHKQWVYVDNLPPTPVKTVGEPKINWDGKDGVFYTDEYAHCWDGTPDSIDCFKVTMDTPITMECNDPVPHPVEHEKVCFMVGLDGDDATDDYCDGKGSMTDEGYCCLDSTIQSFMFTEESEHNLKYYCEDALGNRGDIDEEKFKVLGNMFEIQINKKWNLISVPFDPLDVAVEEVFKDIVSDIEAVYSYDAASGHWSVWRPSVVGPANDLHEIRTGRGYWVMALEDATLLVGGNLYQPGPSTPSSEDLIQGWNLIGYYGTEGLSGYYGPVGAGDTTYCSLYSLRNLQSGYYPTNWGALLTYWELDNPNQWKEFGLWDNNMDPGAGYWIAMDENKNYYPSTTCEGIFSVLP